MRRLTQAAGLLTFLPALAHELSHYGVARLGTDDAQIAVEVTGTRALAAWPPLESRVLRVFAFLAPTVFGSVLAVVWLLTGTTLDGWRLIMAAGLVVYTMPSPGDIRGALGMQPAQQEEV